MKLSRKLLCAVMAALLIASSLVPALAVSVDTRNTTIYLAGSPYRYELVISDLDSTDRITNIRSSDPSVLQLRQLVRETSESTPIAQGTSDASSDYAVLYMRPKKKGTATISFNVSGQTFRKNFKVVDYVNPISSLVIAPVSKSNLKSKFTTTNNASMQVKRSRAAGTLTVKAARNWKITYVRWMAEGLDPCYYRTINIISGVSTARLYADKLVKGADYECRVRLFNTKNSRTQTVALNIHYY